MNKQANVSGEVAPISKLVIPAAGLGTRMFPATLTVPKGLLPLGHHTVIDEVLNEAFRAGIKSCVMVLGHGEELYRDYLARKVELASRKDARSPTEDKSEADWACSMEFSFVRQPEPKGMGEAILLGADRLGTGTFAIVIPDTVVVGSNVLLDAISLANVTGSNVMSVDQAEREDISKYGVIDPGETVEHGYQIRGIVEKPPSQEAPSNRYFNGRAILTREFTKALEGAVQSSAIEDQFNNACRSMAAEKRMLAIDTKGVTFDCGDLAGWHAANCHFFGNGP